MSNRVIKKGWGGKLIGGVLGFWLTGGFFGALFGLFLGHLYDQMRWLMTLGQHMMQGAQGTSQWQFRYFQRGSGHLQHQVQALFTQALFAVLGKLAKSDGHVSKAEIDWVESLMTRMRFSPERRQHAINDFNRGKTADFNLHTALNQFARVAQTFGLADIFVVILVECASSDGVIHEQEWSVIEEVAGYLGVDPNRVRSGGYTGPYGHQGAHQRGAASNRVSTAQQLAQAYKILGVESSATKAEIKKAYRKLMSKHHPDKLVSKGLPEEMMEIAKQKTQEIQSAYDLIEKARF